MRKAIIKSIKKRDVIAGTPFYISPEEIAGEATDQRADIYSLAIIIHDYGLLIYPILFTIVFFETGVVLTPFLPGDSLLFAGGTLAGAGILAEERQADFSGNPRVTRFEFGIEVLSVDEAGTEAAAATSRSAITASSDGWKVRGSRPNSITTAGSPTRSPMPSSASACSTSGGLGRVTSPW
jgi:serine/threonine protein kinase